MVSNERQTGHPGEIDMPQPPDPQIVTDSIREPIRKAITRAIRQGLLGYEGSEIWREE